MTKILVVHGMRMHGGSAFEAKLRADWYQGIRNCLANSAWGKKNGHLIPEEEQVDLVFWGDFFRRPKTPSPQVVAKGQPIDVIKEGYYAVLRRAVRAADRLSFFGPEGRPKPRGPASLFVDGLVYQTAVYMNNGPVFAPKKGVQAGAFHQIQHRFRRQLNRDKKSPCVVIGHSLGTVISYEGLCINPHQVQTFITIGSPMATPKLILEPLRKRLKANAKNGSLPWPGVKQWHNFYAPADVWCVPVPKLSPFFPGRNMHDHRVVHGTAGFSTKSSSETHNFLTYLAEHPNEIGGAIGGGLELCDANG